MSRYIDIEPYEKDGWYLQKTYCDTYGAGVKTTPLKSVPTAEPIKHGRNLSVDYPSLFECSVCGYVNDDTYSGCPHIFTYCPNCGAKMDKAERMTREEAIRRLEEGAPFSELYDEVWENALIMAIEALKAELRSIDLQELEDRFGKYVKFVVEDMMSGEGKRWKNEG